MTGDAVNVAARLPVAAGSGEILVSERTAAAAQAAFLFDDARPVEVKGKRHPLRALPLRQVRALRLVERPALVGRQPDLHQLEREAPSCSRGESLLGAKERMANQHQVGKRTKTTRYGREK